MHKIEKESLVDFFNLINIKFEYVVMRNAQELPFNNYSNDIDILIKESDYKNFEFEMNQIFVKNGFERVERTSFHGIECYTFYNIQNDKPFSVKIDLFFRYEGGGVIYYEFEDVIKFKTKNSNGIFIFNAKTESYLTVLKTFAAGGKPKEEYLKGFLEENNATISELLYKCPSITLKNYIVELIETEQCPKIISRRKIVTETLWSNLIKDPFKSAGSVLYHFKTETIRAFHKQYMIVLVGPDGSGKTTLIENLIEESKTIFRSKPERFQVFHHRPHVLPNIAQIFKKELNEKEEFNLNFNPHSAKQSNQFISFIKLLYYVLDYVLGYFIKLIPLQRESKFIIFDRYYYDFIVDQKRSAISVNRNLAIWLYKIFIPKPNKVFFIKVEPVAAHKRKKELSIEAITLINDKYDRLLSDIDNFKVIVNEDLEVSTKELLFEFIRLITVKNH